MWFYAGCKEYEKKNKEYGLEYFVLVILQIPILYELSF